MKRSKIQRITIYKQVLARRDMDGPYNKENCYWRDPINDWEVQTGIEQLCPLEPDEILLTKKQEKELRALSKNNELTYHIWRRIIWRSENYPLHDW